MSTDTNTVNVGLKFGNKSKKREKKEKRRRKRQKKKEKRERKRQEREERERSEIGNNYNGSGGSSSSEDYSTTASSSSSSFSRDDGVDDQIPDLIPAVQSKFYVGVKNGDEGEGEGDEDGTSGAQGTPDEEEGGNGIDDDEHMQMFPEKHLKELPQEEVLTLKKALAKYADRLKFEDGGNNGVVTSEILTRLILSFKSLLHGVSWLISHVEQIKDPELKSAMIDDTDIWKAVIKIALRDPLLTCGIASVDPKIPSWDKIKTFLFYTEKGRRGLHVVSDKRGEESVAVTNGNPEFRINEGNGYYYYLKQIISIHKDKFHNTSGRHYDLDVSNWNPSKDNVHVDELIHTVPVWSHLDSYADSFIGSYSNMGVVPADDTVVLAYKGRHFKRYNLLTGMDVTGCTDLILPMDCEFLACENEAIQTTRSYEIGNDNINRAYDTVWNTCIAPATCRRHLKERIKSVPHCALYDWYRNDEKIKAIVKNPNPVPPKQQLQVGGKRGKTACAALCDTVVIEKDIIDALYDECALESKVSVAHMHVLKNGDILCILEDNPASDLRRFYGGSCKTRCSAPPKGRTSFDDEKMMNRGFTVVWYRLDQPSRCRVTTLGRFKFSDIKKTRTFVNGKEGRPYPVSVKKYTTNEKVKPYVEFGSTGNCKLDDSKATAGQRFRTREGEPPVSHLINRIVSATTAPCFLNEGGDRNVEGAVFSFAMLVDRVKLTTEGEDIDVQDEIWSMSLFFTETPDLSIKGAVATRINKEHVWGRTTNKNYSAFVGDRRTATATTTVSSGSRTVIAKTGITNIGRKTIARRGFYDRKRARMDVHIAVGGGYACACYCLNLSDFKSKHQDNTLVVGWSEPYAAVSKSNAISLLNAEIAFAAAGAKKGAFDRDRRAPAPIVPLSGLLANVPDGMSAFEPEEPITHETALTVHRIPGPFSNVNPSLVLGQTFRTEPMFQEGSSLSKTAVSISGDPASRTTEENLEDEALSAYSESNETHPCVLVHKSRYRGSSELRKRLDCIGVFDCWMPSLGSTVFEKDHSASLNTGLNDNDVDFDVNFQYDKAWICENLLVALAPASDGKTTCVKVFKFDPSSFSGGSSSANASARALPTSSSPSGADFEIESTENFFLLNSTHIKNTRAIDLNEFVGGRKGKLGDLFETDSHAVLLIKETPKASLERLEKYARETNRIVSLGKKAYDPAAKRKTGECKPHLESRTVRTVKIYSKIWDGDWFESHRAPQRSSVTETQPIVLSALPPTVNDTIFYDFDVNRVCTNPRCKNTGCNSYETKTPVVNWYFCNQKCQDSFYRQMQR